MSDALSTLGSLTLSCVCDQLELLTHDPDISHPGCPCYVGMWPGEPDQLNCCDDCDAPQHGQLTFHVENLFETLTFPAPNPGIHPCAPQTRVAAIAVTILRCLPSMDEQGTSAPPEDYETVARWVNADMLAVQDALMCCLPTAEPVRGKKRRVVVTGTTTVPLLGCAGSVTRAFVDLQAVCRCPDVVPPDS